MRKFQSLVIEDDTVKALYSEWPIDVRKIGTVTKAKKVSDVKFNAESQKWEAIDRKTGKVIATDRSRWGCVAKEHDHYEKMIAAGKYPWK